MDVRGIKLLKKILVKHRMSGCRTHWGSVADIPDRNCGKDDICYTQGKVIVEVVLRFRMTSSPETKEECFGFVSQLASFLR
jgi:hypothetical protein